jgi:photosynthetic reaction center cytochrome c subunit
LHLAADAPLIELYKQQGKTTQAAGLSSKLSAAMEAQSAGPEEAGKSVVATSVQPAEAVFKNIQVLKGIPSDQLIPTMRFMTASLGVECSYCHVEGHFDKDDKKPKQTARAMMRMIAAVDNKDFEGNREVTCYSCHRGSPKPVATPVVMPIATAMLPQPAESLNPAIALPTAGELIAKYIQAAGGVDAIARVKTREEVGQAIRGRENFRVEAFYQDPNKYVLITHLPHGESLSAFNQTEGWSIFPGRAIHDLHGDELDSARMDADLHFSMHIKQNFAELRVESPEKVDNQEAFVVSCVNVGQPAVKLYFDEKSGLLARLVRYAQSPLGLMPTQIDYADYRDVDGVKIPFRWTISQPDSITTTQLEQVQQNIPIDATRFAKPAPASDSKLTK